MWHESCLHGIAMHTNATTAEHLRILAAAQGPTPILRTQNWEIAIKRIVRLIEEEHFAYGEPIPTKRMLKESYGVGDMGAEKLYKKLVRLGYVAFFSSIRPDEPNTYASRYRVIWKSERLLKEEQLRAERESEIIIASITRTDEQAPKLEGYRIIPEPDCDPFENEANAKIWNNYLVSAGQPARDFMAEKRKMEEDLIKERLKEISDGIKAEDKEFKRLYGHVKAIRKKEVKFINEQSRGNH